MTDKERIDMKAGPELNLRVAREVMGEDVPAGYEKVGDHWETERDIFEDAKSRCWQVVEWPLDYSGNIAAAWRVVEKMMDQGFMVCLFNQRERIGYAEIEGGDWWRVTFQGKYTYDADGVETAPLAICLAALEAMGVTDKAKGQDHE